MTNIAVGASSNRSAVVAAVFSVLSVVPILPLLLHGPTDQLVLSDIGLGTTAATWMFGGILALQMMLALASVRDRRWGYGGILLLATAWVVVTTIQHSGAFLPGTFRTGLWSRLAVWGTVGFQAIAALASLTAFRGARRTSFSGTGNFT